MYVTTRGCSTKQWEDLQGIIDHRGQNIRCIRNRLSESCFCTGDNCNSAITARLSFSMLSYTTLAALLLKLRLWSKEKSITRYVPQLDEFIAPITKVRTYNYYFIADVFDAMSYMLIACLLSSDEIY